LTDIVPVTERKRRLTQWDIKPPGYEAVTAEQAKLSGMFPLPGAPRQQATDPTKLQAFMGGSGGGGSGGGGSGGSGGSGANSAALKPTNSRQSKRLVVSNLPSSVGGEAGVVDFFNLQMNGLNVIDTPDPCVLCQMANNMSFAMLEFRTNMDATVALAMDGIKMEADKMDVDAADGNEASPSGGLVIRRPKDYIVPAIVEDTQYDPEATVPSTHVVDSPHKISVTNLPPYLTEDQVMELLISFGKLRSFVLVKDNGTQESRVSVSPAYYSSPLPLPISPAASRTLILTTDEPLNRALHSSSTWITL
jgi:splicing factor U2AF subunit